jgi:hypothetical protein
MIVQNPAVARSARPPRQGLFQQRRAERGVARITSVSKAGAPARRPKETKVSLTKGFDLCSTFCFLEVRRWLNVNSTLD